MSALLDAVVERVVAAHPSCGRLNDVLAIRVEDGDAEAALERFIMATDRSLVVRLSRALGVTLPTPISLSNAIRAVGVRPTHTGAIATTVIRELREDPLQNVHLTTFWRNAVATGMLSLIVATLDDAWQDEAFPAGLLHGLGTLLLDQHAPAEFAACVQRAASHGEPVDDAVRDQLGFGPAELAGAVATRWGLPDWLVECCAAPASVDDAAARPQELLSVVTRARIVAARAGLGDDFERATGADPRATDLVEQPMSALERMGGAPWLDARVSAVMSAAFSPS